MSDGGRSLEETDNRMPESGCGEGGSHHKVCREMRGQFALLDAANFLKALSSHSDLGTTETKKRKTKASYYITTLSPILRKEWTRCTR